MRCDIPRDCSGLHWCLSCKTKEGAQHCSGCRNPNVDNCNFSISHHTAWRGWRFAWTSRKPISVPTSPSGVYSRLQKPSSIIFKSKSRRITTTLPWRRKCPTVPTSGWIISMATEWQQYLNSRGSIEWFIQFLSHLTPENATKMNGKRLLRSKASSCNISAKSRNYATN